MGCVYEARCKVNGKGYVGWTVDLERRKGWHKKDAYDGSRLVFHCAIRKYGWDAFEWSMLAEDDDNDWLCLLEQKWIKRLGTKLPNGYNMTDGGDGCCISGELWHKYHTADSIEKTAAAHRGKPRSEETKKKISGVLQGRKLPPEVIIKLQGRTRTPKAIKQAADAIRGKPRSEETRTKISNARKGVKFTDSHRENLRRAWVKRKLK